MNTRYTAKISAVLAVPLILLLSYNLVMWFMPLTTVQQNTWEYVKSGDNLDFDYTEKELAHLKDVQEVMQLMDSALVVLVFLGILLLVMYRRDRALLQKLALWSGIYTTTFTVMVLLGLLFFFDGLFTLFHTIFFPQGNWQFPVDSLLIQTFPGEFFVTVALLIFGVSLLLALLLIWRGLRKPFIPRIFS